MANEPKVDESHQVLKEMSDAHEEQPGEIPERGREDELKDSEKPKSGKTPLP